MDIPSSSVYSFPVIPSDASDNNHHNNTTAPSTPSSTWSIPLSESSLNDRLSICASSPVPFPFDDNINNDDNVIDNDTHQSQLFTWNHDQLAHFLNANSQSHQDQPSQPQPPRKQKKNEFKSRSTQTFLPYFQKFTMSRSIKKFRITECCMVITKRNVGGAEAKWDQGVIE